MPPLTHPGISRRDLGLFLLWFLLQGILVAGMMLVLWALGTMSTFQIPWSLVAISALVAVACRRGHHHLVLGLGSAALAAQYAPVFMGYALVLSLPLFALLRWMGRTSGRPPLWVPLCYWGLLGGTFLLLPWVLYGFAGGRPSAWLWWHGLGACSLFVLYTRLGLDPRCSLLRRGYFEHLGYVLFPPQRIVVTPVSPAWFGGHRRAGIDRTHHFQAWNALGLAACKMILFHILDRVHAAPEGGTTTAGEAATYLFLHYAAWICWVQAHFDIAVAMARMLGIPLPLLYDRPFMALSVIRWWHRFHWAVPRLAEKASRALGTGESVARQLLVAAASFLLVPMGMVGSLFIHHDPTASLGGLVFVVLVGLAVLAELARGGSLFRPRPVTGWKRVPGWGLTHGLLALAHLFLLNHGHFPNDPDWGWQERWDLLKSFLPG